MQVLLIKSFLNRMGHFNPPPGTVRVKVFLPFSVHFQYCNFLSSSNSSAVSGEKLIPDLSSSVTPNISLARASSLSSSSFCNLQQSINI